MSTTMAWVGSMENTVGAKTAKGIIDPLAIVLELRRKVWLIGLVALVVTGATAAYVFIVPPVYTAWTRLVVDPNVRKPFDDANAPSVLGNEALAVETQLLVASSATVLIPVVQEHDLVNDPEFVDASVGGSSSKRQAHAVETLGKAVTVSREGATYVISIGVKSRNARKSAELSVAIARSYMREQQQFQLDHSQQLAEQIDGRLSDLRSRLRASEEKVQQFRANKRLQGSPDGILLVDQELAGLNAQLAEARAAFAGATAANDEIQRYLKRDIDPTALGNITYSPRMLQLLEEYSRTAKEQAAVSTALMPQHPSARRLKSQMVRLSGMVRDEIMAIGESKAVELEVARQRVDNLKRQMDMLRSSSNAGDHESIELRELEADARSTRAVYDNVLGRAKQLANLEQVTMPVARIISAAQPADAPSWPKKKILVGLAAILGVGLGMAIVVARALWEQTSTAMMRRRILTTQENHHAPPTPVPPAPVIEAPRYPLPLLSYLPDEPQSGETRHESGTYPNGRRGPAG